MPEQPKFGRAERRRRKREVVKRLLDGPVKEPVCGQRKAAARQKERATRAQQEGTVPKNNAKVKRLARERQAATGRPYTECLAEIRAEHAAARAAGDQPESGHG
ncbi:hypothetical protein ABTX35_03595 [Streptomyces sp. NPDC096080]|uniref:hypothetical protein n=1 Tax=Streptomyces sp. NPDC096080 TaxID=3156693 RepID=UPI003322CB9C